MAFHTFGEKMSQSLSYSTAGGVVINDAKEFLILIRSIIRDGQSVQEIRLPKGHIDPGESEEEAAVREVGEESGYWSVEIIQDLGVGHSSYVFNKKHYERDERYYLMRLTDSERLAPRPDSPEEALFKPQWMRPEEAIHCLSYRSEQDFAKRAFAVMQSWSENES